MSNKIKSINNVPIVVGISGIEDNAVIGPKIANASVTSEKLADNSVSSPKIRDRSITHTDIGYSEVYEDNIAQGAIGTSRLAHHAVSGDKIMSRSIEARHMAEGSVSTFALIDESVTTSKIADGSVSTPKISDGSVTLDKLSASAITELTDIPDGSITAEDIADSTITGDKVASRTIDYTKLERPFTPSGIPPSIYDTACFMTPLGWRGILLENDYLADEVQFTMIPMSKNSSGSRWEDTGGRIAIQSFTAATPQQSGVMSASDKARLDSIFSNRLLRTLTGDMVNASDAFAAPPVALVVDGKSVQDSTPTPEAPVPIDSVGSVSFGTSGKNLMRTDVYANTSGYYPSAAWVDHTISGITWTRNEDGSVTANGTATGNSSCYFPIVHEIPAGTTIAMSGCPSGASGSTYRMLMCSTDNSSLAMVNDDGGTGKVATITKAANRVRVMVFSGATVSNLTFRPQVTIGGTVLPYMPHVGAITPIDLQGHELRSLPDGTHDELRIDDDGHVTLIQRVGSFTTPTDVSGVTAFTAIAGAYRFYHTYTLMDQASETNGVGSIAGLSTIAPYVQDPAAAAGIPHVYAYNRRIYYIVSNEEVTDTASAEAWINAHPMTITYKLMNPVTHDLGTVTIPDLPAPDLTAWAACTPSTNLALTYERDINIVIAALEAQLAEIATA